MLFNLAYPHGTSNCQLDMLNISGHLYIVVKTKYLFVFVEHLQSKVDTQIKRELLAS